MRTLVWFRGKDLRIADHAPLVDAARRGDVLPLFVLDPWFFAPERARRLPHRMQFLLESIEALAANLAHCGSRLLLAEGRSTEIVPRLAAAWSVDRVAAHRWTEPFGRERDRRVAEALHVPFDLYEGETLHAPGTLRTGAGRPFSVFTPFARAFARDTEVGEPLPPPERLPPIPVDVVHPDAPIPTCASLGIERNPRIVAGGERNARMRLRRFLRGAAAGYASHRDRMDLDGTSRLSQDLKFGTLSARTVWSASVREMGDTDAGRVFRNELVWREFTHSTLWNRPDLLELPFRPEWQGFPWRDDDRAWRTWTEGATGYPVVDASARQLLAEGFAHNRARMIAASFLTKHLLIDYRRGEEHYLRWLTDGDWAQNNAGWQWSAGCGCDAQPYFRVFNPVLQGRKFDPEGEYVKKWVPELGELSARWVHRPWEAPASVLRDAGVSLGETYPAPVVDHRAARERFLAVAKRHLGRRADGP